MKELFSVDDLEAATLHQGKVLLFKHSTRCPISAAAYREVQSFEAQEAEGRIPIYLVKVIESRSVSNTIASQTNIEHASPQIILLENGDPVWQATHYAITKSALHDACFPM